MGIPFIKIENAGNDYIYVAEKSIRRRKMEISRLARLISDRSRGVGADGLIVVRQNGPDAAFIRIFNRDGGEAELCGNGLRGVCLFLRWTSGSRRRRFTVSTSWNDYDVKVIRSTRYSAVISATLGTPIFDAAAIGYVRVGGMCMGEEISVSGNLRTLYCVAMPNPFAVIFVDNFNFDWQKEGRDIENSPLFKNGINVMFTRIDSQRRISVRPWERGSGPTLACGSGAAAAVAVAGLLGLTRGHVSVMMPGGNLKTSWDIEENRILQEGPSRVVFAGSFEV